MASLIYRNDSLSLLGAMYIETGVTKSEIIYDRALAVDPTGLPESSSMVFTPITNAP